MGTTTKCYIYRGLIQNLYLNSAARLGPEENLYFLEGQRQGIVCTQTADLQKIVLRPSHPLSEVLMHSARILQFAINCQRLSVRFHSCKQWQMIRLQVLHMAYPQLMVLDVDRGHSSSQCLL